MDETLQPGVPISQISSMYGKKRELPGTVFGGESGSSQSESMKGDKQILDTEINIMMVDGELEC